MECENRNGKSSAVPGSFSPVKKEITEIADKQYGKPQVSTQKDEAIPDKED